MNFKFFTLCVAILLVLTFNIAIAKGSTHCLAENGAFVTVERTKKIGRQETIRGRYETSYEGFIIIGYNQKNKVLESTIVYTYSSGNEPRGTGFERRWMTATSKNNNVSVRIQDNYYGNTNSITINGEQISLDCD